jgi:hypothetical protein
LELSICAILGLEIEEGRVAFRILLPITEMIIMTEGWKANFQLEGLE